MKPGAEPASYQIFPEAAEPLKGRLKERLPSIVVEPSEESEELRWTPDPQIQQQEEESQRCDASKRPSLPSVQVDRSRLTPPPSPTLSHAAPPRICS